MTDVPNPTVDRVEVGRFGDRDGDPSATDATRALAPRSGIESVSTAAIPDVTVCVPTKNNADTIERCLESVQDLAAEIVVLDGYSDDGTVEICERYGCSIYQREFRGYADLFRTLIDRASHEWVLVVDSDEAVSEALGEEIVKRLSKDDNVAAYQIWKRNHMWGKRMHIKHKRQPRLARKDVLEFKGDIHEQWIVKPAYRDRVREMRHPLEHYTYERISDHVAATDRYTSLAALQAIERNPWHGNRFWYYLPKAAIVWAYVYFWQRGILDGYRGFFYCAMTFIYFLMVHAKIQDIRRVRRANPDQWREIWWTEECQKR
jgi:(heptosyl)LPS beta-1,4-glucosyltransferase